MSSSCCRALDEPDSFEEARKTIESQTKWQKKFFLIPSAQATWSLAQKQFTNCLTVGAQSAQEFGQKYSPPL